MTCKLDNTDYKCHQNYFGNMIMYKTTNPTTHTANKTFSKDLKSLLDVFVGHQLSGKGGGSDLLIFCSFPQVGMARRAIQVFHFGNAHNRDIYGQI